MGWKSGCRELSSILSIVALVIFTGFVEPGGTSRCGSSMWVSVTHLELATLYSEQ